MAVVGIVLLWGGYALAYYGYNRITGGNDTFYSLVWPGAYTPTMRDDGTPGPGAPGQPPALPPGMTSPTGGTVGKPVTTPP